MVGRMSIVSGLCSSRCYAGECLFRRCEGVGLRSRAEIRAPRRERGRAVVRENRGIEQHARRADVRSVARDGNDCQCSELPRTHRLPTCDREDLIRDKQADPAAGTHLDQHAR